MLSEAEGGAAHAALRLQPDSKLQVLAAMAMSSNADAHGVAAMGLATMCNAPGNTTSSSGGGGGANTALIAKVALPALVRLARSSAADTQCAALDALVVLSDLPQVQRDLVKMGALKVVLERAATPGADNADIRALALQVVQSLASNGGNIGTLQSGEVAARLKGLRQHMSGDVAVGRAVDGILRSISTISTLLELQGKQRLLRFGEVAAMLDCVGVAGAESSIAREVAHTCAAIGARRENLDLFTQEGPALALALALTLTLTLTPTLTPTPNPYHYRRAASTCSTRSRAAAAQACRPRRARRSPPLRGCRRRTRPFNPTPNP